MNIPCPLCGAEVTGEKVKEAAALAELRRLLVATFNEVIVCQRCGAQAPAEKFGAADANGHALTCDVPDCGGAIVKMIRGGAEGSSYGCSQCDAYWAAAENKVVGSVCGRARRSGKNIGTSCPGRVIIEPSHESVVVAMESWVATLRPEPPREPGEEG